MECSSLRRLALLPWLAALGCTRQEPPPAVTAATAATASSAPAVTQSATAVVAPQPLPVASATPGARLEAELHLPRALTPGVKSPLLVLLHGLGASAAALDEFTDWPAFAEKQGIAWLAPNGPEDAHGRRFWNAGSSCCNFDGRPVDHVAAIRELIERALASQPLDPARVFVVGYSNGGFMAHRLACELPGLVRGVASVSGAGPLEAVDCAKTAPVRVLQIHGDADPIVAYAGGNLFGKAGYPLHASAQKTTEDWAARLGCGKATEPPAFDFDARLAGAETRVERFVGCKRGMVELWTVAGGGHSVGFRAPAQAAIWKFLNDW
jgi:polyhydroxybutyrate depolymerase